MNTVHCIHLTLPFGNLDVFRNLERSPACMTTAASAPAHSLQQQKQHQQSIFAEAGAAAAVAAAADTAVFISCFGPFRKTMSDDTLTKMRFIEAYWKRDVGAPLAAARASLVPAHP